MRYSSPKKQTFKIMCVNLHLKCRVLLEDVKTLKNSTCYMLSVSLPSQLVIDIFCQTEMLIITISSKKLKISLILCEF